MAKFIQKVKQSKNSTDVINELESVRRHICHLQKKYNESKRIYAEYKKKINDFKVVPLNERDIQYEIDKKLQDILNGYNKNTKVDKTEADRLIKDFFEKLEAFQRKYEEKINKEIDVKVFRYCREMFDNYVENVKSILMGVEIEEYNFRKIDSYEKIQIADLEEIKKKNETNKISKKIWQEDNAERSGLLGAFKFWKPDKITYTVMMNNGKDVNVKNLAEDVMKSFAVGMKAQISDMSEQALRQIEEYKTVFYDNLDALSCEINNMQNELDQNMRKLKVLKRMMPGYFRYGSRVDNTSATSSRLSKGKSLISTDK